MLDLYKLLFYKKLGGDSGGGGEAVLINKTITSNGTYNAADDSADGYKKVTVNVPNTYAAGDEGKVVSSGALVSQTAHATVTQNGTVDTTTNNSVEVAVSGGFELTTVVDYTVSEAASEIIINSGLGSYDYYEILFSGNTSTAEWIYPKFQSGISSKDAYINVSGGSVGTTLWDGIKMTVVKLVSGNDHGYVAILHQASTFQAIKLGDSFNYLRLMLYFGTSTFQSGFRVLIKGGNLS